MHQWESMDYRRGGGRVGRLRRGFVLNAGRALRGLVRGRHFGQGRGCLPVQPAGNLSAFRGVMWIWATSATAVRHGMKARGSDTRSFPAGCALRILPGPARQVEKIRRSCGSVTVNTQSNHSGKDKDWNICLHSALRESLARQSKQYHICSLSDDCTNES